MKTKGIVQLSIPFASTIALFILFYLLLSAIWILYYVIFEFSESEMLGLKKLFEVVGNFLNVNIFEYRNSADYKVNINTVAFWIINILTIIYLEFWISKED